MSQFDFSSDNKIFTPEIQENQSDTKDSSSFHFDFDGSTIPFDTGVFQSTLGDGKDFDETIPKHLVILIKKLFLNDPSLTILNLQGISSRLNF
jgi:hypothetical protein